MKNKPRFELRLWLAAWSGLLAIFSIFGALRVLPELIYVIYRHGIKDSICNNSNAFGVVGFWYENYFKERKNLFLSMMFKDMGILFFQIT
jgi:hypothetical protein